MVDSLSLWLTKAERQGNLIIFFVFPYYLFQNFYLSLIIHFKMFIFPLLLFISQFSSLPYYSFQNFHYYLIIHFKIFIFPLLFIS